MSIDTRQGTPVPQVGVTTGDVTALTPTSAVLHGHIDPDGKDFIFWGFDIGYDTSYGVYLSGEEFAGTAPRDVLLGIPQGLQGGRTYHYRLTAYGSCGRRVVGGDRTFTTPTTGGGDTPAPGSSSSAPVAPTPVPSGAASSDTSAPVVTVTFAHQRLRVALTKGVSLRVRTSEAGRACASLTLGVRSARRAGLQPTKTEARRRTVVLGSRCVTFTAAGTRTVTVRFTARARRAFAKLVQAHRSLTLAARIVANDVAGNRRVTSRQVRLAT